jgi:predicted ATPase
VPKVKLTKFGVGNFRSIGSSPVIIDMADKITILAGANNSGKSNVLTAIQWLKATHNRDRTLSLIDSHNRERNTPPLIYAEGVIEESDRLALRRITEVTFLAKATGQPEYTFAESPIANLNWMQANELLRSLGMSLLPNSPTSDLLATQLNSAASHMLHLLLRAMPAVYTVPQFRRITSNQNYSQNGEGIIDLLYRWQIPDIGHEDDFDRLERINTLLGRLLHLPDARLQVTPNKTLVVNRDSIRLPLESYGTGIHQLIIMAVAVLSVNDSIICIEEPEIHLHPTLQRELLLFLQQETSNTYVITTHSPALIQPSPGIRVIHLKMEEGVTKAHRVETTSHTLDVLRDLGIRASDLLQANSVLWVEGPSDRILLKKWIGLVAPDLLEGIHFSIMFYGGRLLSHLSLGRETSEAIEELICLLKINQYSAILIDSDRRKKGTRLGDTKQRIQAECETSGVYCWITDGREIENYLPPAVIAKSYEALTGSLKTFDFGPFDDLEETLSRAYGPVWRPKWSYDAAKPALARQFADRLTIADIGPKLKGHLEEVVRMIREACGRPPILEQASTGDVTQATNYVLNKNAELYRRLS